MSARRLPREELQIMASPKLRHGIAQLLEERGFTKSAVKPVESCDGWSVKRGRETAVIPEKIVSKSSLSFEPPDHRDVEKYTTAMMREYEKRLTDTVSDRYESAVAIAADGVISRSEVERKAKEIIKSTISESSSKLTSEDWVRMRDAFSDHDMKIGEENEELSADREIAVEERNRTEDFGSW